jgi:hypothetical protein
METVTHRIQKALQKNSLLAEFFWRTPVMDLLEVGLSQNPLKGWTVRNAKSEFGVYLTSILTRKTELAWGFFLLLLLWRRKRSLPMMIMNSRNPQKRKE